MLFFNFHNIELKYHNIRIKDLGLYWRGPVGPLEDGLEGALEVVLQRADELLLVQRHDTRHPQQQQHQGLQLTNISQCNTCTFVIFLWSRSKLMVNLTGNKAKAAFDWLRILLNFRLETSY